MGPDHGHQRKDPDGPHSCTEEIGPIKEARFFAEGGEGCGHGQSCKEERKGKEEIIEDDREELHPRPLQFHRVEGDLVYKKITGGYSKAHESAIDADERRVSQFWTQGEEGPASADAEHGDADDHKGEVVGERDGEDPRQGDFIAEAGKRAQE